MYCSHGVRDGAHDDNPMLDSVILPSARFVEGQRAFVRRLLVSHVKLVPQKD